MQATAIFFVIMLFPLTVKNSLPQSRKTWKSRNRRQLASTLRLRDTESRTYYLPRTFKDKAAFDHSNSPSFEEVVERLKEIGILDLPNVSVIRMSNSSQSQTNALPAPDKSGEKRCINPCGGCPASDSEYISHTVNDVAILKVKPVECNSHICFNGIGECQLIKRHFPLFGRNGRNNWKDKTIEVPVDCACVIMSSG